MAGDGEQLVEQGASEALFDGGQQVIVPTVQGIEQRVGRDVEARARFSEVFPSRSPAGAKTPAAAWQIRLTQGAGMIAPWLAGARL